MMLTKDMYYEITMGHMNFPPTLIRQDTVAMYCWRIPLVTMYCGGIHYVPQPCSLGVVEEFTYTVEEFTWVFSAVN